MNSENKPAVREIYRSITVKSLRVNAQTVPLTAWTRVSTYTRINSFPFRTSAICSFLSRFKLIYSSLDFCLVYLQKASEFNLDFNKLVPLDSNQDYIKVKFR